MATATAADKAKEALASAKVSDKDDKDAAPVKTKMDPSRREMLEVGNVGLTVEVNGRDYSIKSMTMNERIKVQDHFKVTTYSDLDIGDMKVQRYIVWMLMVKTDSDLTEEAVGDMFNAENQDTWDYIMFLSSFKGDHADMELLAAKNGRKARMEALREDLEITPSQTSPDSTTDL
jgi:hypothetical protein